MPVHADAAQQHRRIRISPASGTPDTSFVLTFHIPRRAIRNGLVGRGYTVTVSSPRGGTLGCIGSFVLPHRHPVSRARVRVVLDPRELGGVWCLGTYHGRIKGLRRRACSIGRRGRCHHVRHRGRHERHGRSRHATNGKMLGRFKLRIKPPPSEHTDGASASPDSTPPISTPAPIIDTTPPTFAGLESAYYCHGGPGDHGDEPASFQLTWQDATDDATPASQIVYDIFVASLPDGEDFSHPNWTTSPGATNYKTPPLPSNSAFFVVRARDQAGNSDQNAVELAGKNACL